MVFLGTSIRSLLFPSKIPVIMIKDIQVVCIISWWCPNLMLVGVNVKLGAWTIKWRFTIMRQMLTLRKRINVHNFGIRLIRTITSFLCQAINCVRLKLKDRVGRSGCHSCMHHQNVDISHDI